MERLGYRLEEHSIPLDAVSIVVNRPIWDAGIDDLNHDQLSGIYSSGISNWKKLGGLDMGIFAVSRAPWGEPDEDERAYLEFVTREKEQAIAESVEFVSIST